MRRFSSHLLLATGLAASSLVISAQAFAYGAGDFFTHVGSAKVTPKNDNGNLKTSLGALDVDVESETGIAFTLGYRFTDKWGVELLAATPFEHDIRLNDSNIASTKHLPPTLTLQFYPFGGTDAMVQPYLGAGVNYTRFSDEEVDIDGVSLELDNSWGAAGQLGVDLLIDKHWSLNAAAWYLDIDSDAKVAGSSAGVVEIDPVVIMAGVGFRF